MLTMAVPWRTGIISVACGIFRAFLMNSEHHLITERILLCTQEVDVLWLVKIPKLVLFICFLCGTSFLASPVGIIPIENFLESKSFCCDRKCFCLASRSCFKLRTHGRTKHTVWKRPVIKLMRDFFGVFCFLFVCF